MPRSGPAQAGAVPLGDREFDSFRKLIYEAAGIHLSDAKRQLVASRLARRLRRLGLQSYADYYRLLTEEDPRGAERVEFINAITTNKTHFFRESHHFDFLRQVLLPEAQARAAGGAPRRLRIWSAGCSTGEEAWSIAMTVRDHLGPAAGSWDVRILASDIDTEVLLKAEAGVYPEERMADVPEGLRRRHFVPAPDRAGWQVRPELRRLVQFRRMNLTEPGWRIRERMDAIFCRNVIIYFDRPTQQRLFGRFADQLVPGGHLIVGHSENLAGLTDRFRLLGATVHRLKDGGGRTPALVREVPTRKLVLGDVVASREPVRLTTLLGSCVAACVFDATAGVGGMNHFLLPAGALPSDASGRYGAGAMDRLVDEVVAKGGSPRRLQAKIFGAGRVIADVRSDVPEQNARFVRDYLAGRGIPVLVDRLGGSRPVEVHFLTHTGKVYLRTVEGPVPAEVAEQELAQAKGLAGTRRR